MVISSRLHRSSVSLRLLGYFGVWGMAAAVLGILVGRLYGSEATGYYCLDVTLPYCRWGIFASVAGTAGYLALFAALVTYAAGWLSSAPMKAVELLGNVLGLCLFIAFAVSMTVALSNGSGVATSYMIAIVAMLWSCIVLVAFALLLVLTDRWSEDRRTERHTSQYTPTAPPPPPPAPKSDMMMMVVVEHPPSYGHYRAHS